MNWDRGYKHLLCKDVSFINNIVYGVLFLCNYDEVCKVLNFDELFDAYFNEFLLRNDIDNHFIILNELITEPKKYDFNFDYNYKLVSTQDLFSGLEIAFQ